MRLGDLTVEATPGTFFYMPRDIPHTFRVVSDVPARWINIQGPTGDFGLLSREVSKLLASGVSPAETATKRAQLSKKHGLEILRPPS